MILDACNYKGYLKGSRVIKIHLNKNDNCMNKKKIQRLMNKYKLVCHVRETNTYRRMQKAKKTSTYAKNREQRNWGNFVPCHMVETDITYLFYGISGSKRAYLATMRDACTKQILSYIISNNLKENFVLDTVDQLIEKHGNFFGYMKNEINIIVCTIFEEVKNCIDDYIYYNNERYQWYLCKMSPNEYSKYIRKGIYIITGKESKAINVA